jgi:hypothetical protein
MTFANEIVLVTVMMSAIIVVRVDTQKFPHFLVDNFLHVPAKTTFSTLIDGLEHQKN